MIKSQGNSGKKIFALNKKAFHDYEIIDKYEAGIVLKGMEVKSIKNNMVNLKDSFILIEDGELFLWNCHITRWRFSNEPGYNPTQRRKLLMKNDEISRLIGKIQEKGLTLVPLSLYGVRGRIKAEVALVKGVKKYDKRKREKEKELKKEVHDQRRKYMV